MKWIVLVMCWAGCGGDKHDAPAPPDKAPAAAPTPADKSNAATKKLVDAEAAFQKLANDGPADAFCAYGKTLRDAVNEAAIARIDQDVKWAGTHDAEAVGIWLKHLSGERCDDAHRLGTGAMIHIVLARYFPVTPTPYAIPPGAEKSVEAMMQASDWTPKSAAEVKERLTANADALCACGDKACVERESTKFARDAMALANAEFKATSSDVDDVKAIQARVRKCMAAQK